MQGRLLKSGPLSEPSVIAALNENFIPVIVDPSHAAGERSLVPPLTHAAVAIGADGVMVEIHPDPDNALSDGPQSLTLEGFGELMRAIGVVSALLLAALALRPLLPTRRPAPQACSGAT